MRTPSPVGHFVEHEFLPLQARDWIHWVGNWNDNFGFGICLFVSFQVTDEIHSDFRRISAQ